MKQLPPLKNFIVALDPGTHTGCAILRRRDNKLQFSGTTNFYDVQGFLDRTFPDKTEATVIVESPKSMLYKRNESAIRNEELQIMYHSGGNHRESVLLAEALRRLGFEVHEVVPVNQPKWDQKRWRLFTGSSKRTSEHERDATRLAIFYANYRKPFGT